VHALSREEAFLQRRTVDFAAELCCQQLFGTGAWRAMLVITGQIRAARSLIRWEQRQLAANAGVAISTVRRLEGLDGPIAAHYETVKKIRIAFERAGIEFIGNPTPGLQIRLRVPAAS
jgi:hypothetical protein